jgi:peptide/nickel transport system substrate-binding protein
MAMQRRDFLAGGLATSLLLPPAVSRAATPGDSLFLATIIDNLTTFDLAVDVGDVVHNTARLFYNYLTGYDPADRSRLLPELAESWSVSPDGLIWTLKIRQGVQFASGNPLTAHDAAWSFIRLLSMRRSGAGALLTYGFNPDASQAAFVALDDSTLRVTLPRPYAPSLVLGLLASFRHPIYDSKTLQAQTMNGDWGSAWLHNRSAGSGPFVLTQWLPNNIVLMQRNDAYWQFKPAMRQIAFRHIPDPSAATLALEKGDVDIVNRLSADALKQVATEPALQTIIGPAWAPNHIAMNVMRKPFDNVKVRQALKYLIDYDAISAAEGPYGRMQQSLLEPQLLGYTGAAPFRLDPAHAKALLAEAGFPNGFATTLKARDSSLLPDVLEQFQQTAKLAGIDIQLTYQDGSVLYPAWRARDYDLIAGWSQQYNEADEAVSDFLYNPDNDSAAFNNLRSWRSGFVNAEANTLVAAGRVEQDPKKRIAIYQRLEQIFFDEGPFIMLFNDFNVLAARRSVGNVQFRPDMFLGRVTKS